MLTRLLAAALAVCLFATPNFAKAGDVKMDRENILATIKTMTAAFAKGDIDTVMSTYEPGATVVAEPGNPVLGDKDLREMFQKFVDAGVAFRYGEHEVVVAGDIGLHLMQWTALGPDGEMSALSVAILRRQPDSTWKMIIDHPFGDGVMKSLP